MNHRPTTRACRSLTLAAAAAACCLSLAGGVGGCDKKGDGAAAPGATAAPAGGHSIGVLNPQQLFTTLGWNTEIQKQRDAVAADVNRELETFQKALQAAVEEQRRRTGARLTADQMDKLIKGDIEKLPLSKEAHDEYVMVVTRANQANQEVIQVAQNAMNRWIQECQNMYLESARPAVKRAWKAGNLSAVFMSGTAFESDPAIDITDKVIEDLTKTSPPRSFPATPSLKLPKTVQLSDLSKPATQPIAPAPGATQPAGK